MTKPSLSSTPPEAAFSEHRRGSPRGWFWYLFRLHQLPAKVNEEWKSKVGSGSTVNWPTGLGGKGNDGIAALVQRLPGSIGYVEYAYAKQNNLSYTKLVSADGKPVSPTEENFANAAKGADWSKSFAQDLTNQKGEDAWPITSTTFILVHKEQKKPEQGAEVLKFFDWAYKTAANRLMTGLCQPARQRG